jgi:hypothetical protein
MTVRLAGLATAGLAALLAVSACGGGGLAKQFEYEEDIYLSLDGSATIYLNASLPALVALRGFDLPTAPTARLDRLRIRALYTTPDTSVTSVSGWRRHGRRFVSVRLEVADIRALGRTAPFSWSAYVFGRQGDTYTYRQVLGPSANGTVGDVGWTGKELVAFRLHVPSKIEYHNAGEANFRRGNILVWEQSFADRRAGVPLVMEVRMQAQSILYRTLWLFGLSALAALLVLGAIIWWVVRR